MKILLASASPRRKQLLEELGHTVEVLCPSFDEAQIQESAPEALVQSLAAGKGRSVCAPQEALLVAADTVVAFQGKILGKPADAAEAIQTLQMLSGNTHQVYTGVYLRRGGQEKIFAERSEVCFRTLSQQEIEAYVLSGAPMDKAGSYGIQETDFVETIQGSYSNIVGFPTEQFTKIIKDF